MYTLDDNNLLIEDIEPHRVNSFVFVIVTEPQFKSVSTRTRTYPVFVVLFYLSEIIDTINTSFSLVFTDTL